MKACVALLALAAAAASPQLAEAAVPSSSVETPDAQQLYALLLTPGPAWKPGLPFAKQGLEAHFYYWKDLFKNGRIATAGPLGSDGGLVLLFARTSTKRKESCTPTRRSSRASSWEACAITRRQ